MKMRIKICGITQVADAKIAAQAGADAIGLVFYEKSPRVVTVSQAQEIMAALPAFVSTVALFVNADAQQVQAVVQQTQVDYLQFHGDESPAYCAQFGRPFLKTVRVKTADDIIRAQACYTQARALLLDTYHADHYGGTGQRFDWQMIPAHTTVPLILAGGLCVNNVEQIPLHPSIVALDISSGVEQTPGIKSATKIQAFCQAVRNLNEIS
jgi:phosphoribosylanthranilate isomerase